MTGEVCITALANHTSHNHCKDTSVGRQKEMAVCCKSQSRRRHVEKRKVKEYAVFPIKHFLEQIH